MRLLTAAAVCLLVASLALAASAPGTTGGGVVVKPDPGFCWGGGIIPQPPPETCWADGIVIVWPGDQYPIIDIMPGGGITPVFGPEAGSNASYLSSTGTPASSSAQGQQAAAPARAGASQMYVPPGVWQWVAKHPARIR